MQIFQFGNECELGADDGSPSGDENDYDLNDEWDVWSDADWTKDL